ncbi:MAG: AfsR/SARP family transcriptional regulator [Sporichthyaceae bacterium]
MGHQIRLLGGPELLVADVSVSIGSAKQWAVLATLALEAGTVVPAARLVDALWGDEAPPSAGATVRGLVHRLRKALGDTAGEGRSRSDTADVLHGQGSGYVLEVPDDAVDATLFLRAAAAGRDALARGEASAARDSLQVAVGLWPGPALGDLAALPAFAATASRLDAARLDAVEDLAEAELALDRPGDALARVEAHLAGAPLRERAWGQLMLALYRLGRQADALAAYQRMRSVLAEELGIEPSPALRDLESGILRQRADLLLPRTSPRAERDTIAFLFTDIEASTRRWEGETEAMAADLARHDKLLAQECESHGGRVFGHTGDGLCAAFDTAEAAVAAAVAGQLALAEEGWEGSEPLRVRMAVHVGAAEARGGNYFGPTLNRTARLMAAAWGGQILCSLAAAELTDDQLPSEVSLRDLGEQRLADLARPERVFQVLHPALPDGFAPLRTAAAVRHNLPVALSSFVGRGAELEAVRDALAASRLVSLLGPGGSGKTRLALAAAAAVTDRHPDGVWLVELASVADPERVAAVVARAVGMDLAAAGPAPSDAIAAHLRDRRALLGFDNCEHVVREAARVAHHLLRHLGGVTVLATSREPLAVPGETAVRVGPLSLPPPTACTAAELADSDAVALFCARAAETNPAFAPTDANAAAVARIAHRLDGKDFSLAAAEAVAAGGDDLAGPHEFDVLDLLGRLADKSMVTLTAHEDSDVRYRLLETVRQYAADKLERAGETGAVRTRHRDFFTLEGNWHVDAFTTASLRWCATEDENVKAALDWSVQIGDDSALLRLVAQQWAYWLFIGEPSCIQWLERAAAVPGTDEIATRVLVGCGLGYMLHVTATAAQARARAAEMLAEVVETAQAHDDHISAAWARTYIAQLLALEGRNAEALAVYDLALPVLRVAEDGFPLATLNAMIADVVMAEGDIARARELNEQGIAALAGYEDTYYTVHALAQLALAEAALGRPIQAAPHAAAAVASARLLPTGRVLVMTLVRAAQVSVLGDRPADARAFLDELLGLLADLSLGDWVAETLEMTALLIADATPEGAATLLGRAAATRGARAEATLLVALDERVEAVRATLTDRLGATCYADSEASGAAAPVAHTLAQARHLLRA